MARSIMASESIAAAEAGVAGCLRFSDTDGVSCPGWHSGQPQVFAWISDWSPSNGLPRLFVVMGHSPYSQMVFALFGCNKNSGTALAVFRPRPIARSEEAIAGFVPTF